MTRYPAALGLAALLLSSFAVNAAEWAGDLTPIGTQDWNAARAAHLLERADKYYRRFKQGYGTLLSLKPSEYSRRQLYYTFIDDPMGLQTYQLTGSADNFMWSTDYPHQAATWPRSQEVVAQAFAGVPEEDKRKMVQENTSKLYGFALG